MPAVAFDEVHFARPGGPPVLDGLSLAVEPGETLALVGRSGVGKTTVLRLINGMLPPTRGSVRVDGRDTREWDPFALRRRAGYVLQDVGLFPHRTVAQNVALVPELLGWPGNRVSTRVAERLALVGLPPGDYADRWPHELSGGQRQRVGLARALAADPPLLLLDEAFGALDPVTRHEVRGEFLAIRARLGTTTILVTHDMHEALLVGDRVGVLAGGRLVACEPPDGLRRSRHAEVRLLLDAAGVT